MSSTKHLIPHHGLITASLMVATTMHALDTTIANVALPHMQGSLSATQEQMSWVITSYIVASAVMTPLGAWLSNRIGRRKFLVSSIAAFTFMSVLCGMAQSLPEIVAFRLLQGLSGAALVPMSQAILLDINPPERHARAMAIWVMGVTVGPIFGAPLGAWITENWGWRWVFYINVPTGIFCMLALSSSLGESKPIRRSFDFFGFTALSIATLSLQLMLDRGQMKDWFNSTEICIEATCAALAAYLFIVHSATARESFINFRVFKDRNFVTNCLLGAALGVMILGPLVLMTSLLQGLMNYPVVTAGMITGSRAIGVVIASVMLGRLLNIIDPRLLIAVGFVILAIALVQMCQFNLQMNASLIFWSGVLYGFGAGTVSISISSVAFSTLPTHLRTEGAAVSTLIRNLGGSVGIAVIQTLMIRGTFTMQTRLAEHITPYVDNQHGQSSLHSVGGLISMHGRVLAQASMLAYNNIFKLLLVLALLCIPFAYFFSKPQRHVRVAVAAE
jgi:DHA2 family multidrug resistance protein